MEPDFLIMTAHSSGAGTKVTSIRIMSPVAFFSQPEADFSYSDRFYTVKVGDDQSPLLLTKGRLAKEFSALAETPVYKALMEREWNR